MSAERVRSALLAAIPGAEVGVPATLDNVSALLDVLATEVVLQIREEEQ